MLELLGPYIATDVELLELDELDELECELELLELLDELLLVVCEVELVVVVELVGRVA